MKNIIGTINLILGSMQVLFPIVFYTAIINKLASLYSSFGVSQASSSSFYLGVIFMLGVTNIALGIGNFRLKEKITQNRFMLSVVVAAVSFFVMGLCSVFVLYSIYAPLYNIMN